MSERPWFRRRTFGWGWTPITWEGWLVTLIPLALVLGLNLLLLAHVGAFRPRG